MDSQTIISYLRQLCHDMDTGRPPRAFKAVRSLLVPVAVPAALALGGGLAACETTPAVRLPQDQPEVCDDGVDNDNDGRTDCGDPACLAASHCQQRRPEPAVELPEPTTEYGAPFPGERPEPPPDPPVYGAPEYMAPMPAEEAPSEGEARPEPEQAAPAKSPSEPQVEARPMPVQKARPRYAVPFGGGAGSDDADRFFE